MVTDCLSYMLPDQVWALSNHLQDSVTGEHKFTLLDGNRIWYMKSPKGYPWDVNTFDGKFVYQSITEQSWTDPKTFKIFASKSWPGANGGIAWCIRDLENGPEGPLVSADSNFRIYSAPNTFTTQNLGLVQVTSQLIDSENFGGDLAYQPCLKLCYQWGATMEVNYYVKGFGWVQWESWQLQAGLYSLAKRVAFNKITAGGAPALAFPDGVPVIA